MGWFSSPAWDEVVYWALDLETGGLDARVAPVLAVGMVPVREGRIRLGEAWRTFVRPEPGDEIDPRSVRAHQILGAEVKDAPPLAQVVPEIARRLDEGVLLVHHRSMDVPFLRRAWKRAGRRWPEPDTVDTAALLAAVAKAEHRRRPELPPDPPNLNLSAARRELGLPPYQAHDAVTDALAAAELFLVLRRRLGARTLRDLTRA